MAVSSKIYEKRDNFNLKINNFPFLDEDVPSSPSLGIYISQLIRWQEYALMLMTSTAGTNVWLPSYYNKVMDTINFVKLFLKLITDTQSWLLNTLFV